MSSDFYHTSIVPYAGIIIKICRAYAHTQEDFEDFYQEVCLQIWRSRDRYREEAKWSTFIYRLALNVCLTLNRKQKRQPETVGSEAIPEVPQESAGFGDEDINRLYAVIRRLSEVDRGVILLYLEERSYQEIAEITGTNANNVGVRINRIKERLKKILDGKTN